LMSIPRYRPLLPLLALALCSGACAEVHRTAIGERLALPQARGGHAVDARAESVGTDTEAVGRDGSRLLSRRGGSSGEQVGQLVRFISWATSQSPKTGNATLTDDWADGVTQSLEAQCPDGVLTGLQTVRETQNYAWFSAEVVHVSGYCAPLSKGEMLHASQ